MQKMRAAYGVLGGGGLGATSQYAVYKLFGASPLCQHYGPSIAIVMF